jgi:hypothetical protein
MRRMGRCEAKLPLEGENYSGLILRAVNLYPSDDPYHVGGRLYMAEPPGKVSARPVRPSDDVGLRGGSGSAKARQEKIISPGVKEREDVITSLGVRQFDVYGALAEVKEGGGVIGIVVGSHYITKGMVGEGFKVIKEVVGVGSYTASDVGEDQRGSVDIGFPHKRDRFLKSDKGKEYC